jgi:hypothetical protein
MHPSLGRADTSLLSDRRTIMGPELRLDVNEHDENPARGNPTVRGNQFRQRGAERLALCVRDPDAAQLKEGCRGVVLRKDHFWNGHEACHDVAFGFVELQPDNFRSCGQELISFSVGEGAVSLDGQIGHGCNLVRMIGAAQIHFRLSLDFRPA